MSELLVLLLAVCAALVLALGGWLRASKRQGTLEGKVDAGRVQLDKAKRVLKELARAVPSGRALAARLRARMLHQNSDDRSDPPVP
jgi:cytochrome c-type biogenesis protein CcmH/NrfG